jgi:hypothetical protein
LTSARPIPRTLPDLHQSHRHLVVSSPPPPWRSPAGPRARARPVRTTCYGRSDCASSTLRSTCLIWTVPAPSKLQRRAARDLSARVRRPGAGSCTWAGRAAWRRAGEREARTRLVPPVTRRLRAGDLQGCRFWLTRSADGGRVLRVACPPSGLGDSSGAVTDTKTLALLAGSH